MNKQQAEVQRVLDEYTIAKSHEVSAGSPLDRPLRVIVITLYDSADIHISCSTKGVDVHMHRKLMNTVMDTIPPDNEVDLSSGSASVIFESTEGGRFTQVDELDG